MTHRQPPPRDSAHTLLGVDAPESEPHGGNGNGGEHTPVGEMTDEEFRLLPLEDQIFRTYKASLYTQEQTRETRTDVRGDVELLTLAIHKSCQHADISEKFAERAHTEVSLLRGEVADAILRLQRLEEYLGAMKASITSIASQLPENRKVYIEALQRSEDRMVERMVNEFANLAGRIKKAEADASEAREQAEEAEDWASKSGQREMSALQMRASKGDAFFEELARRKVAVDEENARHEAEAKEQERAMVLERKRAALKLRSAIGAAVVAIGTALGLALAQTCGG